MPGSWGPPHATSDEMPPPRPRHRWLRITWPSSGDWPRTARWARPRRRWPWRVAYGYLLLIGERLHRGGRGYR